MSETAPMRLSVFEPSSRTRMVTGPMWSVSPVDSARIVTGTEPGSPEQFAAIATLDMVDSGKVIIILGLTSKGVVVVD